MKAIADFAAQGTTTLFQPEDGPPTPESPLQKRLATLVGVVAFGLPIIMALGALIGTDCFRDSISHFYYAPFLGPVFVGMVAFIGGFLIAYTGEHWLEDLGATVAGFGAFAVAVFPTSGRGCEKADAFATRLFVDYTHAADPVLVTIKGRGYFQLFEKVEDLHVWGAALLFIYLGLYCLLVLKRIVPTRHLQANELVATKRRRNTLYTVCGLVILSCVALLGWYGQIASTSTQDAWNAANLTFIVETLALWAFGVAWVAKGRKFSALNDAGT
ncbi:hypothetical protein [Shimia sp.]|uniref:hypothetical protein n=1 Tax=Shimia sp. TaxID=1954381 RepID=UPI0032978969